MRMPDGNRAAEIEHDRPYVKVDDRPECWWCHKRIDERPWMDPDGDEMHAACALAALRKQLAPTPQPGAAMEPKEEWEH